MKNYALSCLLALWFMAWDATIDAQRLNTTYKREKQKELITKIWSDKSVLGILSKNGITSKITDISPGIWSSAMVSFWDWSSIICYSANYLWDESHWTGILNAPLIHLPGSWNLDITCTVNSRN